MADSINKLPVATRAGRIIQRFGLTLLSGLDDSFIDWYAASGTAIDIAGEDGAGAAVEPGVSEEFEAYVDRAAPHVAEFTDLKLLNPLPVPVVFNRSEWIVTTVTNVKPLLESVLYDFIGTAMPAKRSRSVERIARAAMASEMGLLIGYLSGRVLGQYDAPIMNPKSHVSLYFIYPNIIDAEKRLQLPPEDFRLWLALHEVTHGFQFEANPWIKGYLKELIDGQTKYLKARLENEKPDDGLDAGQIDLFAKLLTTKSMRRLISPEENPLMAKAQALMSILEGYSEYVMEAVGADLIGGNDIADRLDHARKSRGRFHQIVEKTIGLEMKIQQYRAGYLFIKQVAQVGGMDLANLVWQSPICMPTLTEIRHPEIWMARMLKS